MGISKFYRFICERYPSIHEPIRDGQILEYENFYLDMNGIIHLCSHPEDEIDANDLTDKEIYENIFHYVDVLFNIIKPKKLFFLAVDGVAPRAKMNQQRARRFRTAKGMENSNSKKASENKSSEKTRFDPNSITPGTEFMIRLQKYLEYFVVYRISSNPSWKNCKVILSGHKVPGEGEHKIMRYIRYMKAQPDYDPYDRHCLYGRDADLLILGLCTHEKNFSILREELFFGRKKNLRPEEESFSLTHLSLLKEYLELEFQELKMVLPFKYNLEKIIDDWVLIGFLLGNDFIPHLPDFHITKGALQILQKTYAEVLPTLKGYLNENGYLNLPRFKVFMEKLAIHEEKNFRENNHPRLYEKERLAEKTNSDRDEKEQDTSRDSEWCTLGNKNKTENSTDNRAGKEYPNGTSVPDFAGQFTEYKRNYYANKLKYSNVTEEVLKSLGEEYVRGLQWILHYYYHGEKSWAWFFPHHYAPRVSDILNFENVKLDFELGSPFLPYAQLLAVLPPGSKNLIPTCYQDLMTSSLSPIKEYYPEEFDTDLNGKDHEWEAVVLIPMINETALLAAMEKHNSSLSEEEKQNNQHGPMLIYRYTSANKGTYPAPEYFADVEENHAYVTAEWLEDTVVETSELESREENDHQNLDLYFPGFPTFKFLDFQVKKMIRDIKVFNFMSKTEGIVIKVTENKPELDEHFLKRLLGKIVHVNWPSLSRARIVAVADGTTEYSIIDSNQTEPKQKVFTDNEKSDWKDIRSSLEKDFVLKRGIDIGETKVIVYVNHLRGVRRYYDAHGVIWAQKVWSEKTDPLPLQTIISGNLRMYGPHSVETRTVNEVLASRSDVFSLKHCHYGHKGKIINQLNASTNGKLKVVMEIIKEREIHNKIPKYPETIYYTSYRVGKILGVDPTVIGKIAGSILVDVSHPDSKTKQKRAINIGLVLKITKSGQKVPGYTRRERETIWTYSEKAINVIGQYMEKFPQVANCLKLYPSERNSYLMSEVFPGCDAQQHLKEIVQWIKNLECSRIQRVGCESELLDAQVTEGLRRVIDHYPEASDTMCLFFEPQMLFKDDLISGNVAPVQKTKFYQLFDRIVCTEPHDIVPLGSRGYITGIIKFENREDYMYDVLFDKSFPDRKNFSSSLIRQCRMSESSFINITRGQGKKALTQETSIALSDSYIRINIKEHFIMRSPRSVITPVSKRESDKFKELWSSLAQGKSHAETKIVKELLTNEKGSKVNDVKDKAEKCFENACQNVEELTSAVEKISIPGDKEDSGSEVTAVQELVTSEEHQT